MYYICSRKSKQNLSTIKISTFSHQQIMFKTLLKAFYSPKAREAKPISTIQRKVQIRFNSGNVNAQRGNVTDEISFKERKDKAVNFQF